MVVEVWGTFLLLPTAKFASDPKMMLKLQQMEILMDPLCERDSWTQKLRLEEEEETEVSGGKIMEAGLQGLESKPQGAV